MNEKKVFKCPVYLSRTISIIALALGVFSCIAALPFIAVSQDIIEFLAIGLIFGIGGLLLLVLGMICLVSSLKKDQGTTARFSFLIGAGWCLLSGALDLYLGIISYQELTTMLVCLFAAVAFLAALVLLLIASIRIRKGKSFRGIGMSGSIVFIGCSAANIFSLLLSLEDSGLTYLLEIALIVLAVFLLVMSIQGKYVSEEEAKKEEAPSVLPTPGIIVSQASEEEEKIHLLKEYKELLDSGVISEEEYEKKKKEILGK